MPALRALCLAFLIGASASCFQSKGSVGSVTPQEAIGLLRNDFAVLVDVREADEVRDGMAQGARWMPMSKIEGDDPEWQAFIEKLPKDKQVIFYCAGGGRAGKAAGRLAERGFRAGNMGGYSDWVKAGLPVAKPGS